MLRSILLLVTALAFSGCGGFREKFGRLAGGTTHVTFASEGAGGPHILAVPPYSGGFMIYIVGVNGTPFSTTLGSTASLGSGSATELSINVPNGQYRFYGITWEGSNAGENSNGCGVANGGAPVVLSGGSATINLQMGTAGCGYLSNSAFADNGQHQDAAHFRPVIFSFCSAYPSSCTGDTQFNSKDLKISMDGYVDYGGGRTYQSAYGLPEIGCATLGANSLATSKTLPPGSTQAGFDRFVSVSLTIYPSTNASCTGTPIKVIRFPFGLANGVNGNAASVAFSVGSHLTVNILTPYL